MRRARKFFSLIADGMKIKMTATVMKPKAAARMETKSLPQRKLVILMVIIQRVRTVRKARMTRRSRTMKRKMKKRKRKIEE